METANGKVQNQASSVAGNIVWKVLVNVAKAHPVLSAAVCTGALIAGGVSIVVTGKMHNPVEKVASDIVEEAIGVDIDEILPNDHDEGCGEGAPPVK